MKLVPSWPEANRTRRSKSEPGRNQASTNPMQRRSRRSLQALWSPPVGCPWRFKPCKCIQMEIHRKTYKNYLKTFYTSSESLLLAMRPTWMPWIVTESDFICRKSVLPKYIKLRPALSIWSCKEENSKLPQCCTKWTCWNRGVEVMSVTFWQDLLRRHGQWNWWHSKSIRMQLAREMRSAQHLVSDPTNLSDINAHNCQSVFAI